jgi:hypothetical protein
VPFGCLVVPSLNNLEVTISKEEFEDNSLIKRMVMVMVMRVKGDGDQRRWKSK